MTYRPSSSRSKAVAAFYEQHPYPAPDTDLEPFKKGQGTLMGSPSHFNSLLWPARNPPESGSILIAGCGTSQAAKYALLNPGWDVLGIDLSEASLRHSRDLASRYRLSNLSLQQLSIEQAAELAGPFDLIVSTGVLHHLPDPQAGLNALAALLAPNGVLHAMVYAKYGRTGVYMLQQFCRSAGIEASEQPIRALQKLAQSLPRTHPLQMFAGRTDDLQYIAGVADALLHPQDRAFTVPQIHDGLNQANLKLQRWMTQAPYLIECCRLDGLDNLLTGKRPTAEEGQAMMELLRGNMLIHEFLAVRKDSSLQVEFSPEGLQDKTLVPMPGAKCNVVGLPSGVAAQLWHANHEYPDLLLPLSKAEFNWYGRIGDGIPFSKLTDGLDRTAIARFCETLWQYDQIMIGHC